MKRRSKRIISLVTSFVMVATIAGSMGMVSAVEKTDDQAVVDPQVEQQVPEAAVETQDPAEAVDPQTAQDPAAEPQMVMQVDPPIQPEPIVVNPLEMNKKTVTLSWEWTPPEGLEGYFYTIECTETDLQGEKPKTETYEVVGEAAGLIDKTYTVEQIPVGDKTKDLTYGNSYLFKVHVWNAASKELLSSGEWEEFDLWMDAPDEVQNLKALSGYNTVTLKWDKIKNTTGDPEMIIWYRIFKDGKLYKKIKGKNTFTDKKTKEGHSYKYTILPVFRKNVPCNSKDAGITNKARAHKEKHAQKKGNGNGYFLRMGKTCPTVKGTPVRPMYIKVTVASSGSYYTTYKGHKSAGYFKSGTKFKAFGAKGGRYMFVRNGKVRYFSTDKCRNAKADYTDKDYEKAEKEYFVNQHKYGSGTKYLVWVSTYTQRCNYFVKKNGKWKLERTYRCSTGKASTPTPTGVFRVWNRVKWRHSIPNWTCFYSYTALHQKLAPSLGVPRSGGCVRLIKEAALFFYKHLPKRTTVVVY